MSAISDKYASVGGSTGFLGAPKDDERDCPDGVGKHQHFQKGSIHWSPKTGAHITLGLIRKKWELLNWEVGPLGYPITDEDDCPGGKVNEFEEGTVIWRQDTKEAYATFGAIRQKWQSLGRETGLMGFPVTDELTCPDGRGKFNHFEAGSIYWTMPSGAHEVHGLIRGRWADLGWETSFLGYPTSDERDTSDGSGRYNDFQGGRITWSRKSNSVKETRRSFKPRLVRAVGSVHVVDDEGLGGIFEAPNVDEHRTVPLDLAATITEINVPERLLSDFKVGVGGEVRFELDLDVRIAPDDFAIIDGNGRIFEGTSESTNNLIAGWLVRAEIPPNELVNFRQSFPAGDSARVEMKLTNVVAP